MKTARNKLQLQILLALALAALTCGSLPAQLAEVKTAPPSTNTPPKVPDVVFVPTRMEVVEKMLQMAEIKTNDVVYDLGCGDGRFVVEAAKKYGVRGIGIDIDPQRVKESNENVRSNKVAHLVTIKQADIFETDFSDATVVMLYLLPDLNVKLMPKLAKLKPGTRILSNDFDMRGAKPKQVLQLDGGAEGEGFQKTIYKWVVPWEKQD
jgi:trans-aconitate methyltransferase